MPSGAHAYPASHIEHEARLARAGFVIVVSRWRPAVGGGARIVPRASDGRPGQGGPMAHENPIFTVTDRWGDEICLTQEDWDRIVSKRPGVEHYVDQVRLTLQSPNMVYEGRYADSKVFYKRALLDDDPLYKGCYVAVVVRYTEHGPASLRTVYFPYNIQAALGNLLHIER
jgi:hypothetical protein